MHKFNFIFKKTNSQNTPSAEKKNAKQTHADNINCFHLGYTTATDSFHFVTI